SGQPGRFVLYENWASEAAWQEHMQMPYLQEALAQVDELFVDAPDLEKIQFSMLSDWSRRD
ncbi:MAG: putative quinol monooxygenase, partial [Pirellulaceae bacterium]